MRDYIHVEDLAAAHIAALEKLEGGESRIACNLGTGTGYSVKQVIEVAREVTGHAIPAEVAPRRPGDPDEIGSGGKITRNTGAELSARIRGHNLGTGGIV